MIPSLPSGVHLDGGRGSLPRLSIDTDECAAELYLYGAHLCRWRPRDQPHPVLWMSEASRFEAGAPIRGGVPVCFPWFGPKAGDPSAPGHGVARINLWSPRQLAVAGEHRRAQGLGQRHVDRIVRRQIVARRPDAVEQGLMVVTLDVERPMVVERGCGLTRRQCAVPDVVPERQRRQEDRRQGKNWQTADRTAAGHGPAGTPTRDWAGPQRRSGRRRARG